MSKNDDLRYSPSENAVHTAIDLKIIITGAVSADTTISAITPAEVRNAPPNWRRSETRIHTRSRRREWVGCDRVEDTA
ncbi:hypothetical protein SAMN05192541_15222 [Bradyrhizobium arachidis]|nr:hypothetical protein SAMN05192541_15222 [Bradyrhizobium arachidis]